MPKHLNYKIPLKMEEWKQVRAKLASGDHVEKVKIYLSTMTDNIRVFITDGEGFGDQMFVVNIIEQLRALGYMGIIEVIGYQEERSVFLSDTYKSSLRNILKLYDAEHLFERDFLFFTTSENTTLHFYDYNYFKANRDQFAEVEIALFPGLIGRVYENYYDASFLSFHFTSSYFDVFKQLVFIVKSKRALFFSVHTAQLFEDIAGVGFALQLKGQKPKIHFLSHALSYPKLSKPFSTVRRKLLQLKQKKPLLGSTLERVMTLQEQRKIYTFAIYAVHHFHHPQYALKNLLLGSKLAHKSTSQPLLVLIMSPLSDEAWSQLQNLDSTVFLDIENGQTLPNNYDAHFIYVLRLPSLPWILFDHLFISSTYPPVYEGVNAALGLRSYPKVGLPCPKLVIAGTSVYTIRRV